jgi:glycerol kinase
MAKFILGIDLGTTITKAVILDHDAKVMASVSVENKLYYPQPGWVEQDPDEILDVIQRAVGEVFKNSRIIPEDIEAIGISNQMATTIFWNKYSGKAIGRAISWQDIRTIQICERITQKYDQEIKKRTGTNIVTNSSASKILWLMENDRAIQKGLANGELLFGTIDTWLVWKLSGGEAFITDISNSSLGLLFNTHTLTYDDWLINEFGIPREILPEIRSSSEIYAYTRPELFFNARIPIAAVCGDQFAAIFGQACYQLGTIHCNLGTGSGLTLNTGNQFVNPIKGIQSPILWAIDGKITRGFGSWTNFSGSAIQWLRDELGIINDFNDAEIMASRVPDSGGVYFVPSFSGISGPHDDPYARGTIFGISQNTSKNHLVRAALEAMAFQVRDSFDSLQQVSKIAINNVRVGGGGAKNDLLMQFLANILGIVVERPVVSESSVLGAAFLAGLATGFWESTEQTQSLVHMDRSWKPEISKEQRDQLFHGWNKAIERSSGWLKD